MMQPDFTSSMALASRNSQSGISFLQAGSDESRLPIVLLHGIGSSSRSFESIQPLLGLRRRVIAWDAPGYGASEELQAEWPDASSYALALAHLMDECSISRAVVVGHSLGALIAACFARIFPQRAKALVLLSPACGYGAPSSTALPSVQQARVDELSSLGAAEFARRRAPRLVFQPEAKPEVCRGVEQAMASVRPRGYTQAVRLLSTGDIFKDLAALEGLPTFVGWGVEDAIVPPEKFEAVSTALNARSGNAISFSKAFASCGHALPQECPEAVVQLIEEFLMQVEGGAA